MAYPMRWLGIGVLGGLVLIVSVRETAAQRLWSGVVVALASWRSATEAKTSAAIAKATRRIGAPGA